MPTVEFGQIRWLPALFTASGQTSSGGSATLEVGAPDAILAATNLTGTLPAIVDDPANPDATWLTATDSTAPTDLRVSFATPPAAPATPGARRRLNARLRRAGTGPDPTALVELYESGAYRRLLDAPTIPSTSGQTVSAYLEPRDLADSSGAGVELRIRSAADELHVSPSGDDTNAGTRASPLRTIAAGITAARAANAAGRTSLLVVHAANPGAPSVYRESISIPSGGTTAAMTVLLEAGVVVSGADRVSPSVWTAHDVPNRIYWMPFAGYGVQAWPDAAWSSQASSQGWTDVIRRRELVVIDGRPMRQVLTLAELTSYDGACYQDDALGRLYVRLPAGTSLPGVPIEVGMRQRTFEATSRTGLHLVGEGTLEHAVSLMQQAGVFFNGYTDCVVDGLTVRGNVWGGLKMDQGTGAVVSHVHTDDNGVLGFGGYRPQQLLLVGGTSHRNNTTRGAWAGYKDWEDGAAKFFQSRDITLRRMDTYANNGPGPWWDTDNKNVLLEDCRSDGNTGAANFFFEITQGPVVLRRCKSRGGTRGLASTSLRNLTVDACQFWNGGPLFTIWALGGPTPTITEWDTASVVSIDPGNWTWTNNLLAIASGASEQLVDNLFGLPQSLWDAWKASFTASGNAYYAPTTASIFRISSGGVQSSTNLAGWQTHLGGGRDGTSTYTAADPSPLPTL